LEYGTGYPGIRLGVLEWKCCTWIRRFNETRVFME
jgi:hypothetical protein